jgi:hypothetical protein
MPNSFSPINIRMHSNPASFNKPKIEFSKRQDAKKLDFKAAITHKADMISFLKADIATRSYNIFQVSCLEGILTHLYVSRLKTF